MMEAQVNHSLHFSHEHPLEYLKSPFDVNYNCSGCKLTIMPGTFFYWCKLCQFFLHKVCYGMPRKVLHPVDPNHHLTLSATSTTNQSNNCMACGRYIPGFCYSCTKCSNYYHMLCIAMPLSVQIPSSHPHILKLELKPPYDFQCDLCDKSSCRGWLYRCNPCKFDAHISCAATYKGPQSAQPKYDSLDDDRRVDSKATQHELMEILSEGMKVIWKDNDKNIIRDLIHEPQDQSNLDSEDFTLASYQFSDACFSIDIAKSIQAGNISDSKHTVYELEVAKSLKRELSLAPSTGIGSHVWMELDQENKKSKLNATNDSVQFKDRTTKMENVNMRRPFWSKLLWCF